MLVALSEAQDRRLGYGQLMELLASEPTEYRKGQPEVQMARLRKKLVQAGAGPQPIKAAGISATSSAHDSRCPAGPSAASHLASLRRPHGGRRPT